MTATTLDEYRVAAEKLAALQEVLATLNRFESRSKTVTHRWRHALTTVDKGIVRARFALESLASSEYGLQAALSACNALATAKPAVESQDVHVDWDKRADELRNKRLDSVTDVEREQWIGDIVRLDRRDDPRDLRKNDIAYLRRLCVGAYERAARRAQAG